MNDAESARVNGSPIRKITLPSIPRLFFKELRHQNGAYVYVRSVVSEPFFYENKRKEVSSSVTKRKDSYVPTAINQSNGRTGRGLGKKQRSWKMDAKSSVDKVKKSHRKRSGVRHETLEHISIVRIWIFDRSPSKKRKNKSAASSRLQGKTRYVRHSWRSVYFCDERKRAGTIGKFIRRIGLIASAGDV